MSRTYRKKSYNPGALRNPKTSQEIRQIQNLLTDLKEEDYLISGVNHLHRRLNLPTHYDDIVASSYYQSDYDA